MPDNAIRLTLRETEVLLLIYREYSSDQIAHALHLSKLTVDDYRKSLLKKTGTCTAQGLVKFALVQKLISL